MTHKNYTDRVWHKAARLTGMQIKDLKKIVHILHDLDLIESPSHLKVKVDMPTLSVKISKDRLMRMACYDPLTKIPNEFLFKDRVSYLISMSQRVERKFAIMFIDLDRFKSVNDTYGHAAGDYVLVTVAAILKYAVRKNDIVARLHGDEFVILFDDVEDKNDEVHAVCEKIKSLVEKITYEEKEINIGASMGFAFYPKDGKTVEELLNHSDGEMYSKKHNRHI